MSEYLDPKKLQYAGYWLWRAAMLGDAEAIKLSSLTSHHLYRTKRLESAELFECVKRAADLGDVHASRLLGGFHKQGFINTNDKVVCIDDTDYGYNVHDTPNGFLQRGRVYCVSGWSKCGGLILAGLPCLWKKDGGVAGFNATRFRTLECFRIEVSEGGNFFP
jgi:hypothetical protein